MTNTLNETLENNPTENENPLDFIGKQIIISDPRYQAYGLAEISSMDLYANKFFIMSSSEGVFISPTAIPDDLRAYYEYLDLDISSKDQTFNIPHSDESRDSLSKRISNNAALSLYLKNTRKYIIPYMLTDDGVTLSEKVDLPLPAELQAIEEVAGKTSFQSILSSMSEDIFSEFGYEVGISHKALQAGDEQLLKEAFANISQNGGKDIVVIKPLSAAGKGVFFFDSKKGLQALSDFINQKFEPGEEVLIEEAVPHNASPSMQGGRTPNGAYSHFYLGKQNISVHYENGIGVNSYDSNAIPFGIYDGVNKRDIEVLAEMNRYISQQLLADRNISGINGLDSVVSIKDGKVTQIKYTEANMHFPGSIATYAAIRKLYPGGFSGVTLNLKIPYVPGSGIKEFMRRNSSLLIKKKGDYGIFPIDANYTEGVDLILFEKNLDEQSKLLASIN